eukprot:3941971-Prymnesium_polylepis.2
MSVASTRSADPAHVHALPLPRLALPHVRWPLRSHGAAQRRRSAYARHSPTRCACRWARRASIGLDHIERSKGVCRNP